jgi:nitroreductase
MGAARRSRAKVGPDLYEVMRTTPATREFTANPVDDAAIYRLLDCARFAPSGGNRQGWRVISVRDPAKRRRLRDLLQTGWREYVAHLEQGLVPFAAPEGGRLERPAIDLAAARARPRPNAFFDRLDEVPALLAVCADLGVLSFMDAFTPRQSLAGGASIYPFVHNLLLAARGEGLGGVLITLICREEPAVRELLGIPPRYALACLVALGRPARRISKLKRRPVEEFATLDRFDGPPLRER